MGQYCKRWGEAIDELGLTGGDFSLEIRNGKMRTIYIGHPADKAEPQNREAIFDAAVGPVVKVGDDMEATIKTSIGEVGTKLYNVFPKEPLRRHMAVDQAALVAKGG